jgi:NAD(P)-dependent dehydrogenase (short-subunit alcohol dehydrogenase family)
MWKMPHFEGVCYMLNLDYTGRHVVVTGGTGALGTAVVRILLDSGAVCHVPASQRPAAPGHDRLHIESPIDLTDESAVGHFYGSLPSLWASVHVAGGFAAGPIGQTSLQMWKEMHDTNGVTCFLCCREAIGKMRGSGDGGRIVNVAAKPALIPAAGLSAYAASKAMVTSLTLSLSEELAAEKIWVNAVVPSIMDTPANRQAMPDADFDKWPKLSEVAATIAFLASPQNQATRGALAPVYGSS